MNRPAAFSARVVISTIIAATALSACSQRHSPSLQGYVEGEFVYVASSQAGRLQTLAVLRGQKVEANAPLFSLEAVDEAAARLQAQRQLDSSRAQLAQAQASARSSAAAITRDEAQYQAGGLSQAERDVSRALADADAARV